MKNIIICQTPLQVLIAEKIIEKYNGEPFIGIYLTTTREPLTQKIQYYIDKLRNRTEVFYHFRIINPKFIGGLSYILHLNQQFKRNIYHNNYNRIFIANINSEAMYSILDKLSYESLITFDDGFGNINEGGVFFIDKLTYKKIFIRKIFRLKHNLNSLKKESKKHYTIYKNIPNALSNPEFLSLFNNSPTIYEVIKTKEVSILLGQPLYIDDKKKFGTKFVKDVYTKLNPTFYLPHPLEHNFPKDLNLLNIELIAEEYINELISQGYKITLYSFFSSVLFSFKNLNNVKVISICNSDLLAFYPKEYDFIKKQSIEILSV